MVPPPPFFFVQKSKDLYLQFFAFTQGLGGCSVPAFRVSIPDRLPDRYHCEPAGMTACLWAAGGGGLVRGLSGDPVTLTYPYR